jgi:SAM-dependent methyltransferase
MRRLWNVHSWRLIYDHERTDREKRIYLGFPIDYICDHVIRKGLTDFNQPAEHSDYGKLVPEEKVLLYFAIFFPNHFFSSYAAFDSLAERLESYFARHDPPPLLIDVGCGPATSALALLDLRGGQRFAYYGVDNSLAMRQKAKELLLGAKDRGLARAAMRFALAEHWETIPVDRMPPASRVIINFSYFCASHSLDESSIKSLAGFIGKIRSSQNVDQLMIVYTNSTRDIANSRYLQLLKLLNRESAAENREIEYRKSRFQSDAKPLSFRFESLILKGD